MKHFVLISAILGFSVVLCSCSKNDSSNRNTYEWGFLTISHQFDAPEENILNTEAIAGIRELQNKYYGSGTYSSDNEVLEIASTTYKAALSDFNTLKAKIDERIKVVDNYGCYFKITTNFSVLKNNTSIKDEKSLILEMKGDGCVRFDDYTTVTEIPLTDELKKKDPASYTVTVDLTKTGASIGDMESIKYDSVKVYAPSTRVINTDLTFISEGNVSPDKTTLTLTFTGSSSSLAKMKGEWYANAYITIDSYAVGIVRVPFKVN